MSETWEVITRLGPIVVGLFGLLIGSLYNRRTIALKQQEDERKEIYKKLNSFYGPLLHLRGASSELYGRLTANRSDEFRTLTALLAGESFEGNDRILIEEIVKISEKIDDLVAVNSGLIDDEVLRATLSKAAAHYRLLRLAYKGDLASEADRFKSHVFPRELDEMLRQEVRRLKKRLEDLNK